MEDLKKKINFDSSLLYYSPTSKENEEDEKSSVTNVETYNSTNRKHVCTVCGKRFFSLSALSVHIDHHPPNERSNIEKDDDNTNPNRKNQYVWNKGSKCNKLECNFIALDAVEYSKHISTCEGIRLTKSGENISFCELCDSYFSSENHFKAHLILQHPDCDPDISLQEYDAKYTTVSDPVSLYVSENNSENDNDVKPTKNLSHSKYPDSSISKRKSKEGGSEELVHKNQDNNKTMEEANTAEISLPTDIENTKNANQHSNDSQEKSTKNPTNTGVSKISADNDHRLQVENNKYHNREKVEELPIQSHVPNAIKNEKSQVNQSEVSVSNQNDSHADFNEENDRIKSTSASNEEIDQEVPVTKKLNETKNKPSTSLDDGKSIDKRSEMGSEELSDKSFKVKMVVGENEEQQNVGRDEKIKINSEEVDSKNVEMREDVKCKNYMNVEKMMYNLFKDEETSDAPSQESGKIQNMNDVPSEKLEVGGELNQSNSVADASKEDSDFEEFDYNRAGKKKYLKSYGRINKIKTNSNEEKVTKISEDEEKVLEKSEITDLDDEETKKKKSTGRKREKCLIEDNSLLDLNIKERSTRTRKKLILPDFEYDSDYKSYTPEAAPKRTETSKRSSLSKSNDSGPRKRGRPRKNPDANLNSSDANRSSSITDISTNSTIKSVINAIERIENSYLTAMETPMKRDIADIITNDSDFANNSTPAVFESNSFDEEMKKNVKPKVASEKTTKLKTLKMKKKRGRPPKIKTESKHISKSSELPSTPTETDKTSEESIFSDVANALLSLSDSVPMKKEVVQNSTSTPVSQKIEQVHIIKRKKLKTVKPIDSNETRLSDDFEPISTFALKNDVDADLADDSTEIDNDLSFNDANRFEKEKESEENSASFMKDIPPAANASTPRKRGRPPKPQKGHKSLSVSQKVSDSEVPSKPKLNRSLQSDYQKRISKHFDSKLSDRKSVFLKNKTIVKNEVLKDLKASMPLKKKGRPSLKSLQDATVATSLLNDQSTKSEEKKQLISCFVKRPIHDISIDESNDSEVTNQLASELHVSKKKKRRPGRPPKSVAISDTSIKKDDDVSKTLEKDLNLNELKNTPKSRDDSPFIYESYQPKKKRARLEIGDQKDSEKDDSISKTDEYVVPKKVPRIAKPKKIPPPPPVEEPDETRVIDENLYLEDVKSRTKYGKLFKKPKNFIYDEKYSDDMMINCGRCKKKMTFRHYKNYHQISHYYICWIEGDKEIDLNDDSDVVRILQSAITPEALKKKAIRLACEKCDDVRKSVVGYVSHVRFCQKEDKNSLFETCKLCGRALRPSSVRFHYIKFHGCYKPSKGGMCFSKEADLFNDSKNFPEDSDDAGTPIRKRFRMGFTRSELQKQDVINDEEFWTELKTSYDLYMCMGLSCRHMAISKEELKSHVLDCHSRFCEFSCSSCEYKTKYENEIIYHSKKKCPNVADEKISVERTNRVTTRGKTLNFKYDNSNDFNESDDEKRNGDRDFEVDDDKSDDDEYEDSDMELEKTSFRKSFPKRRKAEVTSISVTDKLGLRNAFQQFCTGRTEPLRWTVDLRLKLYSSTPLHVHMKVISKEWEILPSSETDKYIPAHKKSVKAYFDNGFSSQYDLFQADVIKGVPLCYVGGPVWAMAWAPTPAHVTEQYLAISTLQHMNQLVEINGSISFPSLIQIWKFNSIDNISNDIQKPVIGWSIAHSYGAIWSMEWCPSGGFNNLSTTSRLGILAAATSTGCVVVYNVPKLEIGDKEPGDTVTNPKPDLILKIRNDNVQCTRIVWDQISPHNSLIGGFSDGSIAFWNINTASVLLKKGNVIYPYRTFEAHNSPVTALDLHWLNNSRFLLTGSMDRVTRHWDLNDLSGPINEYERPTPIMNALWMQHWIVTANVHDFGNLVGESGAYISHPRDPFEKKKTVMNVKDAFWSLSYSLWNDMLAISSNGGYVSAYAAKHLSMLTYKAPDFEKTITSTELVNINDEEKKNFLFDELTSAMPSTNDLFDCTEVIKNSGIRFIDRAKSDMNSETLGFDIEKSSPTSVNKVCWNQNYNSFNWLAIGYECGFVRVIRVERFDKHYLTKFYKTNENTATLM